MQSFHCLGMLGGEGGGTGRCGFGGGGGGAGAALVQENRAYPVFMSQACRSHNQDENAPALCCCAKMLFSCLADHVQL